MSEEDKGSVRRDYRGTKGAIDDADGTTDRQQRQQRFPRGRTGVSRPKSPRQAVRDPGKPTQGSEGEPSYGAPMDDKPEDRGKKK